MTMTRAEIMESAQRGHRDADQIGSLDAAREEVRQLWKAIYNLARRLPEDDAGSEETA